MFTPGYVIVLDLDRFEEFVKTRGLSPYRPNIVTGTLTSLVEDFVKKWNGVVIYGLDPFRGTEEAVIEVCEGIDVESIERDLEKIRSTIESLGSSITIVVVKDYVTLKPATSRREAYSGTPGRRRAWRLVRLLKKRGGNVVKLYL